jgi:hypothetical protein
MNKLKEYNKKRTTLNRKCMGKWRIVLFCSWDFQYSLRSSDGKYHKRHQNQLRDDYIQDNHLFDTENVPDDLLNKVSQYGRQFTKTIIYTLYSSKSKTFKSLYTVIKKLEGKVLMICTIICSRSESSRMFLNNFW